MADRAGIRDWVRAFAFAKWRWAGHVARRGTDTWLWKLTSWRDAQWTQVVMDLAHLQPRRPSTRRWMKWEQALQKFCLDSGLHNWIELATDKQSWLSHVDGFVDYVCRSV